MKAGLCTFHANPQRAAETLDHKIGIVLASLGKALLEAIEVADLEGRVKALEKRICNTLAW